MRKLLIYKIKKLKKEHGYLATSMFTEMELSEIKENDDENKRPYTRGI